MTDRPVGPRARGEPMDLGNLINEAHLAAAGEQQRMVVTIAGHDVELAITAPSSNQWPGLPGPT